MEANVLERLPEPIILKRLMRIQAALNIILCQDEWLRYHSFVPEWDEGVGMAKIDNGAGDHLLILFSSAGCIIKGFDHESELSPYAQDEHKVWQGIYDDAPKELLSLLNDDAIEQDDVTFCIWRETSDTNWHKGKVEVPEGASDGTDFLIGCIFHTPEDFAEFAKGYFELSLSLDIVAKIYDDAPITAEMIKLLNPDCDVKEVLQELKSLHL
ncbi:hypothetical protein [Paenibacillus radicis (ex Gao et al. 2016)]|uniref:Uncharacterized protein n=1 Tax=Paenibacillus radicis (ex Gao et al. 2016) TaxID=1737354 RepID=A0A917GX83_9BACL|nr:hypothetical protein [Paenibacillus radicis (ex Gao et al. 2016)]GGG60117.1 hypothetical protein GCM10010918_11660 [Paenibacillus radicis (ex Gao et al. 2016)]